MKKLITTISVLLSIHQVQAIDIADAAIAEANLAASHAAGMHVYTSCILTPPLTHAQVVMCEGLQRVYEASLVQAAAPMPLSMNTYPSPYSWSPFDICRYEPSVLIFPAEGGSPICPSI